MIDGVYQSVLCFFIPYLTLVRTSSGAMNGLDVASRLQLGAYIAHPTVLTINLYILINTYRWDWLMLLVVSLSDLFVFFWTGVYSSTSYSEYFYKTAPQIYGQATFWAVFFITPVMCLFPRYAMKALQKVYFPYDVDIIREQMQMGMFKDLEKKHGSGNVATGVMEKAVDGTGSTGGSSSEGSRKAKKPSHTAYASVDEDRRPIYPPSVATHNTRTQNGSDDTNYSARHGRLSSIDDMSPAMPVTSNELGRQRRSIDRARPSYDRMRMSMDRVRPSFEASNEFTSAKRLSMLEGMHSASEDGNNDAGGSGSGTAASRFIHGRLRGLSIKGKQT